MSSRVLVSAFTGVIVAVVAVGAQPTEGPVLRVLVDRGPSTVTISAAEGGALRVVGDGWTEKLSPGIHTLAFEGRKARLGSRPLDGQTFGLRATGRSATRYGNRQYVGWIDFVPPRGGTSRWQVINRVPMERYLVGVLAREMGPSFHPAALAAQAIASRSYALYHYLNSRAAPYHVTATTQSQVYDGLPTESVRKLRRAVEETGGQVLFFRGKVFEPFYHSTCGGFTASGWAYFGAPDIPPLSPVRCGYCRQSPFWRWQKSFSTAEVEGALRAVCKQHDIRLGAIRQIRPVSRGPGGHAAYVQVVHSQGRFEIDAAIFRQELGNNDLRSTAFACEPKPGGFVFSGRGWGHGVGMCQYGVQALAERGYDAVGILKHYYRGSRVFRIW